MRAVRPLLPTFVAIAALAPALSAQAPAAGGAGVRGTVTDAAGRPLARAAITRNRAADTAWTDSLGRYAVTGLPLGRHVFLVQLRGFDPIEMEINFPSDTVVTVDIPLEPARGDAAAGKLDRVGFTQRRSEARPGMTFLGPEELLGRSVTRVTEWLERVRDIHVRAEAGNVMVVFGIDRRCLMKVWIDGQQETNLTTTSASGRRGGSVRYSSIDEILRPGDVAGIEVYPRGMMVPSQFQRADAVVGGDFGTTTTECGALVIWTRR